MPNLNNQIYPAAKLAEIQILISRNLAIVTIILIIIFTIYKFKPKLFKSSLTLGLILELFIFARSNLFTTNPDNLAISPPDLDPGLSRYLSTSDTLAYAGPQVYFNHLRVRQPFASDLSDSELDNFFRLKQELAMLPGNLNVLFNWYNASGYSAVVLDSYTNYFNSASVNSIHPIDLNDSKLQEIGVNYLVSGYPDDYVSNVNNFTLLSTNPPLYQSTSPSQRIFLQKSKGIINNIDYNPNQIVIQTFTTEPDQLIITDSIYPGWKAVINNQPVDILPYKNAFRQISLPKGQNTVKLSFRPKSFNLGAIISILSFIILVILQKWPNPKSLSS